MGDDAVRSTMDNRREYPIVIVNMSDKPGGAVNTLAKSLLKKLKDIAANDPSLSVSIESLDSNRGESPSWAITTKSTDKVKRYLLSEFHLPSTKGPKFADYFVWILRAPVRAAKYLWYRLCESMGTGARRQKAKAVVGTLPKIVMITVLVIVLVFSYSYLMLFMSLMVVNPLRRWRLWMVVLYLLTLVLVVALFTWKSFLPPLVLWISQFTQQLLALVHDPELSFNLLFSVTATVIFSAVVSIVVFLVGLLRRVIPKADAWMIPAQGVVDFAYLLDPLYAATARGAFEKRLLKIVNKEETQRMFVICEHVGILLAYEVLSRACPGKIDKPVHLLTRNLDLAGVRIDLPTTLWLLVEPTDWSRFASTTPCELSWHHWTPWPSKEFILKMNSAPQGRVPQVQHKLIEKSWKSSYSMSVNRLIALADQA